ncbi:MAG: zinc-dependent metalloprotease family protein, partial [Cyanobium sp.]
MSGLSRLQQPEGAEAESGPDPEHEHAHEHEHEHEGAEVLCSALPREDGALAEEGLIAGGVGITAGAALMAFGDTFRLSSNPTASKTIYLDFNGHTTSGTAWNNTTMGPSFYSPAYNTDGNAALFSNTELTLIQRAWQRISADFAPFDVNVTTMAPPDDWLIKTNAVDPNYGIRVVMTSYGPSSSTAGGIAYIDSFNWGSDTPCFVYNTSLLGVTEAVSHEVGHTLGLSHDGTAVGGAAYYSGHGSGENGWASIMGVGYYQSVTQWDDGTFYDSNNGGTGANYNKGPDDLAIITSYNGFGYLPDQEGNSQASANALSIQTGSVSQYGTIETRADLDWFQFTLASSGAINLSFSPYWFRAFVDTDGLWGGPVNPYYAPVSDANTGTAWADNGANLDLAVELYNSANVLLASSNPIGLSASLNVAALAADTYYLKLDGVGFGTPTVNPPSGYSDYASLGSYLISGTITGIDALPEVSLALGPNFSVAEDGTTNLVWTFSRTGDTSAALTVNVTLGGSGTNGIDYTLSGWTAGTVTFDAGQATAIVTADPTADTAQESDETVSLQLAAGPGYGMATT